MGKLLHCDWLRAGKIYHQLLRGVSLRKSKTERIRKLIFRFFTRQINPRYLGSWCLKGTEESTLEVRDSSVPLTCHDPKDLGSVCLVKKRKIGFQILFDLKMQFWIFLHCNAD